MDDKILRELQKMNKFLEAIDWKLWNFYEHSFKNTNPDSSEDITSELTSEPEEIPVQTVSETRQQITKTVISVPKYPSIEEL